MNNRSSIEYNCTCRVGFTGKDDVYRVQQKVKENVSSRKTVRNGVESMREQSMLLRRVYRFDTLHLVVHLQTWLDGR